MAWTIRVAAQVTPGVVRVDVTGDPQTSVTLWRTSDQPGVHLRQHVRGAMSTDQSGALSVLDMEAPVDALVIYYVEANGKLVAASNRDYVPAPRSPLGSEVALIRSVQDPQLLWETVTVFDERPERQVSADVFPVLGRTDPVVVSDVLRLESGTLVLVAEDIGKADKLIEILTPGSPVLYRTPCSGKTRDKILTVVGAVQDTLVRKDKTWRLLSVPYQQITWPADQPHAPQAPALWTYAELDAPTTTAPTYDVLASTRRTYYDLSTQPVTP